MKFLEHLSSLDLDTIEVEGGIFEGNQTYFDATPKNIQKLVETINMLISQCNALKEKNDSLQQQLSLIRLTKGRLL